jgi:hypothetical protein
MLAEAMPRGAGPPVLHPAQIRQKANRARQPPDPRRDPVCRSAAPSVKGRASCAARPADSGAPVRAGRRRGPRRLPGPTRSSRVPRSEETLPRSPGPTPLQVSPAQLPVRNRENLRPATARADEVSLHSSSCRSLRPSDLRPGQSGRRLPPSLDIPPGYARGIGVAAGLLAVYIRHVLRKAILR